jgi:cellulose synthase/poly-beta-1,6-N-acetylglucosamine synthase-like glycosyltransferase
VEPVNAATARNRGLRAAQGEVFAFTDADCLPYPEWLERLYRHHAAGAMVVGGGVQVESDNYWAQSDNVSMFHDFIAHGPAGTRPFLPTLNLSVRRSVVEAVGGMDESFPGAAAEDTDWTIRMRRAGYDLYFDPEAIVQHAPARTTWRDVGRHWRNLGKSAIRVRLRYPRDFNTPALAGHPGALRLFAPLIAARVTAGIYARPHFWRYWASLPVVYATKVIFCLGAAETVAAGGAGKTR